MVKHSFILLVSVGLVLSASAVRGVGSQQRSLPLTAVGCRHDASELPQDRMRREQALAVARAINAEQGALAQQTRQYQPFGQLRNVPPTPDGFELRFYGNGSGYMFSIKDQRDSCHYSIFSDQDGRLYEASSRAAQIAS